MEARNEAAIITIGDELLIGQVVDTNSAWMAQELNKYGIRVTRRVAVGDNWDDIWNALDEESAKCRILLITGGLGPTADDITKPLLCKYFGGAMTVNQEARDNVLRIFETILKRPAGERNLKQAEVPDNCTVIQNRRGTAPGMWFEKNGRVFVSMPGVPHEMKGMMETDVIPRLLGHFSFPHIAHRTLLTAGIGESVLADLIQHWEEKLPPHVGLAYLPNYGMVRLRLTIIAPDKKEVEKEIDHYFTELQDLVKDHLVTNRDESMEQVLARLLTERGEKLAIAESCTGGYIAHLLTSIPGASAYLAGGFVSYANEAKETMLGLTSELLIEKGAVSEEVVRRMAEAAKERLGTDYAIAVSGIMGPEGGSPEKPVGTVWMAATGNGKTIARKLFFRFDRQRNIQLTAISALNMLRQLIRGEDRV